MNHHIIYKQKATVTVSRDADAFAMQNEISDLMKNDLPLLLQDVFDSVTLGGDIIRIDSLQLDLGVLPAQTMRQVFAERVAEKIRESIIEKTKNNAPGNGVSIIRKEQSLREAFLYFLQYGNMPWFIHRKNRKDWESEMQKEFGKNDWQKIVLWLRQNHQQQRVIIDRLIHQFSGEFLESVITNTISFDNEKWKDIYLDLLFLLRHDSHPETHLRVNILQLCIASFLDEASLFEALYKVIKKLTQSNSFETKNQAHGLLAANNITGKTKTLVEVLDKIRLEESQSSKRFGSEDKGDNGLSPDESKQPGERNTKTGSIINAQEITDETNADDENVKHHQSFDGKNMLSKDTPDSENKAANDKSSKPGNKLTHNKIEEESQYISNAGIVLLHPFLEMYFTEFGLLQKRKFVNDDACKRAVLLLHYLATGETESEEWNLLLQKMMCGLSFDETLPNKIELIDKEKEESERLLQSVINYCPPLKNTSLAGLRSTFLQRDGRLETKENGWLLIVEQKTVDVLLDKLPWGFSAIKFPWLVDMITVDWC